MDVPRLIDQFEEQNMDGYRSPDLPRFLYFIHGRSGQTFSGPEPPFRRGQLWILQTDKSALNCFYWLEIMVLEKHFLEQPSKTISITITIVSGWKPSLSSLPNFLCSLLMTIRWSINQSSPATYHVSFLLPFLCSNLAWSKLIQLVIKFPCHTDQLAVNSSTNKTCHWRNQTLKPHNLIEAIFTY